MNINASKDEVAVATEMYCYFNMKVTEMGISPAKVHALFTAAVYTSTDPVVHVDGVEDGRYIQELMEEHLEEMQK